MTPRRTYYINYIDPETGFLKREEFNTHRECDVRIAELNRKGVRYTTTGSYEET